MFDLVKLVNNMWFMLNLVEGLLFLIFAVYFTVKPERVSFMITNFDRLPSAQREQYDLQGLSRYVCRAFTLCGVICIAGGFAAVAAGSVAYWISTALWVAVAVVTMRADNEKLLKKYRKG